MSKRVASFDFEVHEHIRRKEIDEDHAVVALLKIAKYLREYGALPSNLAEYLADAIVASMVKPKGKRAKAFTDELGLTANNARPKTTAFDVGMAINRLKAEGLSEDAAKLDIADAWGLSKNTVSNHFKEDKAFSKKFFEQLEKQPELLAELIERHNVRKKD